MKRDKETKNRFSRRDFVRTTAVGVGATALAGLGSKEAKAMQLPPTWDYQTDVLVIGAGIAGLVSALVAATQGAKVIVLEKTTDYVGGTSINHGGQFIAYGPTSIQKKLGTALDPTKDNRGNYYKLLAFDREDVTNLDLVNLICEHCNEAFEWTISIGHSYTTVTNTGKFPFLEARPWTHNSLNGGFGFAQILKKNCDEHGVTTLMGYRATQLITNSEGEVIGATAAFAGKEKNFKANRAVVLATGGFAWNPEMQKQFSKKALGANPYSCRQSDTGDGIKMGQAVGADLFGMQWASVSPASLKPPATAVSPPRLPGVSQPPFLGMSAGTSIPAIWVNKHGYRFVDESFSSAYGMEILVGQDDQMAWAVFDSAAIAKTGGTGVSAQFDSDISKEVAAGYVTKADTLSDLANAIGISPPNNLVTTVAEYNVGATNGQDLQFGKTTAVSPISSPPYYAARIAKGMTMTFGGLKINSSAQVVDTNNKPVPRLYGVGRVTGGYLTRWYNSGGCTFPELTVLGRIAGQNAAAETSLA